jgi:hypothetical protein
MEAAALILPIFVQTPYGQFRQVGAVEAELGTDVEACIDVLKQRLRGFDDAVAQQQ